MLPHRYWEHIDDKGSVFWFEYNTQKATQYALGCKVSPSDLAAGVFCAAVFKDH